MADIIKGDLNETQLLQDIEFQQIIRQIGGKENIYLVSEYCKTDEDNPGTLQEFLNDMFCIACPYSTINKSNGLVDSSLKCTSEKANENNYSCKTVIDGKILPPGSKLPLSVRPKDLGFIAKSVGEEENTSLPSNGDSRRTGINSHNFKRTIDCPLVIFIFRQDFLKQKSNKMCLKEILKDVRARTKGSRPALLGLIRSGVDTENTGTGECLELLARLIHSVFRKHHAEEICVGNYIPKSEHQIFTIKRNVCKLLLATQTSDNTEDRGNPASWPFQCLPWPSTRRHRGQGNNALSNSKRGSAECVEEGIPLKASALSAAHHSEIVTSKNSQHHDKQKS